MNKERFNQIRQYLLTNQYIFNEHDLLDKASRKKFSMPVSKSGKEFIFYAAQKEYPEICARLITEIKILEYLKEFNSEIIIPKLSYHSISELWYVRESLPGEVSGNVYLFSRKFLDDPSNISKLIKILSVYRDLKPPIERFFSSKEMINNLQKLVDSKLPFSADVEKLITFVSEEIQSIDSNLYSGFIHRDLQPTNILISGSNIIAFDYEQSAFGNIYFDFASLFHRAIGNKSWQSKFLKNYKVLLENRNIPWNERIFKIINLYYLAIDISSINSAYLSDKKFTFHNTNLDEKMATLLLKQYLKEFKSSITSLNS